VIGIENYMKKIFISITIIRVSNKYFERLKVGNGICFFSVNYFIAYISRLLRVDLNLQDDF